jgi:hypothetical protein
MFEIAVFLTISIVVFEVISLIVDIIKDPDFDDQDEN